MATAGYYLLVHIAKQLSPLEGKGLVTTVFIAHGLLSDLFGIPLDFTEPVARVIHAITNIPMHPQASHLLISDRAQRRPSMPFASLLCTLLAPGCPFAYLLASAVTQE